MGQPNGEVGRLVKEGIARLRLKLLDLTNRNRLLNFKFSESSRKFVRLVDEVPNLLYARLSDDSARSSKLYFEPLPEPPPLPSIPEAIGPPELVNPIRPISDEKPEPGIGKSVNSSRRFRQPRIANPTPRVNAADWARENGIDPTFDLPRSEYRAMKRKRADNVIQTLLFPDALQGKLAAIREEANLAQQELGLGTLFAAFGFLEWYESTDSNQAVFSPLMLVPVQIDRELKQGEYRYYIESGDGADPTMNVSLRERLKRDFALALPDIEEGDTPELYIERVERVVLAQKRWKIRPFVVIGHFSFARLVMYEDLAPESWQQSPLEQNQLISTLLAGAAEGSSDAFAPEFDVDEEAVEKYVPVMITDADSSQFSAIVDAMQGRSFALKGPPGTGKSQTITNLIGAALAANKRVLFVAEKQAALDVVAKRLHDAGLGPFLFELHSTKTQKKKMLEGLESRLRMRKPRSNNQLAVTLGELRNTRAALKAYVSALNSTVGRSEITLHGAYWYETRARHGLEPEELRFAHGIADSTVADLTPHMYTQHHDLLGRISRAYMQCLAGLPSIARHPLFGVDRLTANPADLQQLRNNLREWDEALSRLERVGGHGGTAFSCKFPATTLGLSQLADAIGHLPDAIHAVDLPLLSRIRNLNDCHMLEEFLTLLRQILRERVELSAIFTDLDAVLPIANRLVDHAERLDSVLDDLSIAALDVNELPEALNERSAEWASTASYLGMLDQFAQTAAIPRPISGAMLADLVDALALVKDTSPEVLRARDASLFDAEARGTLERLMSEADSLLAESQRIQSQLSLTHAEKSGDLTVAARALRDTHPILGFFSPSYRSARRFYRNLSKERWMGRNHAAEQLLAAADLILKKDLFDSQESLKKLSGATLAGINTPFRTLLATVDYWQTVRRRWPTMDVMRAPIQRVLLTAERSLLTDVADSMGDMGLGALRRLAASTVRTPDVAAAYRLTELRDLLNGAANHVRALLSVSYRTPVPVCNVAKLYKRLSLLAGLSTQLRTDALGNTIPLDRPPNEVDVARVEATLKFAAAVLDARIPPEIGTRLLSQKAEIGLARAKQFAALIAEGCRACDRAKATICESFSLNLSAFSGSRDSNDVPIFKARERIIYAQQASDELFVDWAIYRALIEQGTSAGLGPLCAALESQALRHQTIEGVFRVAYMRGLIRGATESNPELPTWTGDHVETLRRRLVRLDDEYMSASRTAVAVTLLAAEVPVGVSQGPVKSLTERSLIEHEIGKQRRHTPIRDLLLRAARATRALKPCFMMSPASVAQFLPPGGEPFDLAIIDEASQMKPEEALGVAARAKQIVVVGDPMQLPPTTFFDTNRDDDESEQREEELDVDTESILDMALSSLRPPRELRWHYRSKHHSLIDFSNHEFYNDQLIVFPSPKARAHDMGVQWVHVPDGIYQASLNVVEANVVVETVAATMRARPQSSIGVVAINQPQKDYLLDCFDSLFAHEPDLEEYRARWDTSLEPFFVKNLENVQGDERDIIVISIVYGPETIGGPVAQRFGPINARMGHRRLNVLFTRAKERVVVVSTLRPEDIKPPSTASRGVVALKGYLEYARSGRLERGTTTGESFDSPFEAEVAAVLAQHGHKVATQVGVAGYFIDLAVRHAVNTDHFVLGIECDGASYHSARSARDRDRLRQEILERLGWTLHRIWSTDWFQGRDREVRRLLECINRASSL